METQIVQRVYYTGQYVSANDINTGIHVESWLQITPGTSHVTRLHRKQFSELTLFRFPRCIAMLKIHYRSFDVRTEQVTSMQKKTEVRTFKSIVQVNKQNEVK